MIRDAWWTCALLALASARIYERCEFAKELMSYGVESSHISTWVCIAYHESRLDTSAQNHGSGDHGIFQISELYWCGPGKACGVPCTAFRDEDIKDDVECSLMIHEEHTRLQGNGFMAWVVYPQHCRQNTKKYLADCDGLPKNATIKTSFNSHKIHDFLDNNITHSYNPVRISGRQPSYLTVSALVNKHYENDIELYYTRTTSKNWLNYKIDNIDELTLPVLGNKPKPVPTSQTVSSTRYSITSTTASPLKPWRTIESNQFRNKLTYDDKDSRKASVTKDAAKYDKFPITYSSNTNSPTFAPTTYRTPATYRISTITTTYRPQVISYRPATLSTASYRFPIATTTLRPLSTIVSHPFSQKFSLLPTQRSLTTKPSWHQHRKLSEEQVVNLTPRSNFGQRFWTTPSPLSTKKTNSATNRPTLQRSTQSIFDLYLNPTKRPPISAYNFRSTNESPFKLRIFAGGTTTPSPFLKSATFQSGSRNQLRRDIQFHT
ncbi:mucin-5AC-like [Achroia grisella]|uniref:mucin-5AC-like n=1 Tax=Achroia grisella TaxID=688607 RepID=UPI0027D27BB4|nr:mucin-5AC-like [Achroia grisella]